MFCCSEKRDRIPPEEAPAPEPLLLRSLTDDDDDELDLCRLAIRPVGNGTGMSEDVEIAGAPIRVELAPPSAAW